MKKIRFFLLNQIKFTLTEVWQMFDFKLVYVELIASPLSSSLFYFLTAELSDRRVRFLSRWIFTRIGLDFASLKEFVLLHFIFLVLNFILELYCIHKKQIIAIIIYRVMYGRSTERLYFYHFHFANWCILICLFFSYITCLGFCSFQISDNQTGIISNSIPGGFCIAYIVIQILSRILYSLHKAFMPV